ncbi:MAG: ornithine cyclodeaminase/alanine dehydrogenase-like protein (mu-crystallin family), partial [Psychrobacter glaciei]
VWTWDDLSGDLQALVTGELKEDMTKSKKGITLFKSVGAASFDAAVALYIAKQAVQKNIGSSVDW